MIRMIILMGRMIAMFLLMVSMITLRIRRIRMIILIILSSSDVCQQWIYELRVVVFLRWLGALVTF